jgi:hypothetical protein
MKLLNIFNWVQLLVESFTFYGGASSSGGGAMNGGERMSDGKFDLTMGMGRTGYDRKQLKKFDGTRFDPTMGMGRTGYIGQFSQSPITQLLRNINIPSQVMPPMPQGMPTNQGQPMQGQVSPELQVLQGLLTSNLLNTSSVPYNGPQY